MTSSSHTRCLTPSASQHLAHGLPSVTICWMNKLYSLRTHTEVTDRQDLASGELPMVPASKPKMGKAGLPHSPTSPASKGHNDNGMMRLGSPLM